MAATTSSVTADSTNRRRPLDEATASRNGMVATDRRANTSFCRNSVYAFFTSGSYFGPRNANGAISAPVLTPVTTSNSGRLSVRVQPLRTPAVYAP
jgi:hypothetical protein